MSRYVWTGIIFWLLLGQVGFAQATTQINRHSQYPATTTHRARAHHKAKVQAHKAIATSENAVGQQMTPPPAQASAPPPSSVPERDAAPMRAGTSLGILAFIGFGVLAGGLLSAMKTPSIKHD